MNLNDKIIVALDVPTLFQAQNIVESLSPHRRFKVGLQLITAEGGPQVVAGLKKVDPDIRIFYDGKFHDIPNTVGEAAREVSKLGVEMFNIHASSGKDAIVAAVANRGGSKVFGVTVLTSIKPDECLSIYGSEPTSRVRAFVDELLRVGAQGVICSPQELSDLRHWQRFDNLEIVTPGVRPLWAAANDQKRVMVPFEAFKAKATAVVIGRPLTNPPKEIGSPKAALQKVIEEIAPAF